MRPAGSKEAFGTEYLSDSRAQVVAEILKTRLAGTQGLDLRLGAGVARPQAVAEHLEMDSIARFQSKETSVAVSVVAESFE